MKKKDILFNSLFETIFYGGSFYDGVRVGHPEEFDLDLLFTLPTNIDALLTITNINGFLEIQLKDIESFEKNGSNNGKYRFDNANLNMYFS